MFTSSRLKVVFFGTGVILAAYFVLFGLGGAFGGASATAKAIPNCDGQWEMVASPNVDGASFVRSISVVSDNDIWAVGSPSVMHWDGSVWSEADAPNLSGMEVTSVEAISSNDVWAVGDVWPGSGPIKTLTMHWNGSAWSVVSSPNSGAYSNYLYGVHALASDDVWAVGSYNNDYTSGPERTLVLHWDGTSWSITPSTNLNEPRNVLQSIGGISSNDLWAVGYYDEVYSNPQQGPDLSLVMHWDGIGWSVVDTPNVGGLRDIFRVGSTDIWTVGSLPLHWNGGFWEVIPGAVLTGTITLLGIDGATANDIWAVGYRTNGSIGPYDNIIEHWDGTNWTQVQSVNPGEGSTFSDVAVVSGRNVWAGGTYWPGGGAPSRTLMEHFDAESCSPTPTPIPVVPACGPEWHLLPEPALDAISKAFTDMAAISANDVWAVGRYSTGNNYKTLIEHWNGTEWSVVHSPNVGDLSSLQSVAGSASNDVWAVGQEEFERPIAMHWNGTIWSLVPTPNLIHGGGLYGVLALASNNAWAVGWFETAEGGTQNLIEHWDGSAWHIVDSPNFNLDDNRLTKIAGVSANDLWAIGYATGGEMLHWNGSAWSMVQIPTIGNGTAIMDVAAIASNDVWAVGFYFEDTVGDGQFERSLTIHWDGSHWSIVSSPNRGLYSELDGVDAIASNDAWAVGRYREMGSRESTFVAHWNGAAWNEVPSPNASTNDNVLVAVAAISGSDVLAVGNYQNLNLAFDAMRQRFSLVPCPPTPTPEPPRCPGERFTDNCPGDYFYQHVLDLNDLGVVSGYTTSPPCETEAHVPCFKPYNSATRGQIAKVVALAAGFNQPVTTQTFEDVPVVHTFYLYVERLASLNILSGYPCGGPGEPCGNPARPYFRPGNTVSRGQLAKIAALAFGFLGSASTQTFEDVPPGHTFYDQIEMLAVNNIIGGYPCGNPEPCVPPGNRPYYRPGNDVSRGQIAKIVNLARTFGDPTVTPGPTVTNVPSTATPEPTLTAIYTPTELPETPATATSTPTATTRPGASPK